MARVRVLPAIVHTSYDHVPGDVVELRDDIALTWCNAGLAEPYEEPEPEPGDADEQAEDGEQTDGQGGESEEGDAVETPEDEAAAETPEDSAGPETPEAAAEAPEKTARPRRKAR